MKRGKPQPIYLAKFDEIKKNKNIEQTINHR